MATSWSQANMMGCTVACPIGFVLALIAWIVTAHQLNDGIITVDTLGQSTLLSLRIIVTIQG